MCNVETAPYESPEEYELYKRKGRDSKCLRTENDWRAFFVRVSSSASGIRRHVADYDWSRIFTCVMGHRLGVWNIPTLDDPALTVDAKCRWINQFNESGKPFKASHWKNAREAGAPDPDARTFRGWTICSSPWGQFFCRPSLPLDFDVLRHALRRDPRSRLVRVEGHSAQLVNHSGNLCRVRQSVECLGRVGRTNDARRSVAGHKLLALVFELHDFRRELADFALPRGCVYKVLVVIVLGLLDSGLKGRNLVLISLSLGVESAFSYNRSLRSALAKRSRTTAHTNSSNLPAHAVDVPVASIGVGVGVARSLVGRPALHLAAANPAAVDARAYMLLLIALLLYVSAVGAAPG